MSEELIKRLRDEADILTEHGFEYAPEVMREAADALSRPAPAVQVPEGMVLVSSDTAEEAADWLREAAATLKARHSPIEGEWGKYSLDKQARREHDAMLRVAALLAAAPTPATVATEAVAQGYIVGNGDHTKFRKWGDFGPEWTHDKEAALRFSRRQDAEAFCADDEDAGAILPVGQSLDTKPVRFIGVNPLDIVGGAVLPMLRDSWRFGFYESQGELCFGYHDDGPLVAFDADEPVAQGGGVDDAALESAANLLQECIVQNGGKPSEMAIDWARKIAALLSASPAGVGGFDVKEFARRVGAELSKHEITGYEPVILAVAEYVLSAAPAIAKQGEGE